MSTILDEMWCVYCQKSYKSPRRLQKHVLKHHPDTYAAEAIEKAKKDMK